MFSIIFNIFFRFYWYVQQWHYVTFKFNNILFCYELRKFKFQN